MTGSFDLEREVVAWLSDAGPQAPRPHVVDDALLGARSVSQRHSALPLLGVAAWPRSAQPDGMGPVSLFVALVALAVAGMALLLAGSRTGPPQLRAGPVVAEVSPAPRSSIVEPPWTPTPSRIPKALVGTWVADLPSRASVDLPASGQMRLTIGSDGVRFELPGLDNTGVLRWSGWVDELTGELRLMVNGPSVPFASLRIDGSARGACALGAIGVYRWQIRDGPDASADRLQLDLIHDQCSIFDALVPGTWVRVATESPPTAS